MARRIKKRKGKKPRNWLAVRAFLRGGAGSHKDKKKEASKNVCRKKVEQ